MYLQNSMFVDGRKILNWMLQEWEGRVSTWFIWVRIGAGGPAVLTIVMNCQVP